MKIISSLFLLIICSTESARILGIFPTPSYSHQVVFQALIKDLAARGHHLTILTTDLIKINNNNVTQIDLHDSYEICKKRFNFVELKNTKETELGVVHVFHEAMLDVFESQLTKPEVMKLIAKNDETKFDLLIIEHLNFLPYLAFAEIYRCPVIGITSFEALNSVHEWFGNVVNPAIHPEMLFPYQHARLTFSERWKSLKYQIYLEFFFNPNQEFQFEEVVKKHFPTIKSSIAQLKENIQFLMINTHPAMGFIRPLVPKTIQLGFMHIEPPKPLAEGELKTFLDNSKHGVIYMSLGSNVQSKDLSPEILEIFLSAFRSLSYNFILKYEADHLPNKPDNVMISKWLPQSDLLAHPAIKLFITQGGQQSMEEAIDRAVPMIVIPFMIDQDANGKKMQSRGIGMILEFNSLSRVELMNSINEMLKPKYKKNIEQLKMLVNDQPMTSREKAVWWTEYVIRHKGAKHLEYQGRSVPFYQRYFLDFIAIGVVIVLSILLTLKKIVVFAFESKKIKSE